MGKLLLKKARCLLTLDLKPFRPQAKEKQVFYSREFQGLAKRVRDC